MTLETHLTPPTSSENVSMASEVHLTSSTSHGNVLANSETPLNPSTSGIFNTYNLGTQVKLPKLDLRKFDGDISKWPSFWDALESSSGVAGHCHCQQTRRYLPPGSSQPAHTAEKIMHLMPEGT